MRPFAFGAGVSAAGGGTAQTPSIRTISANATLTAADYTVRVDTTSGNVTVTLPTGSTYQGIIYQIKKVAAANTVTISSTSNIDGQASFTLSANDDAITVQYDNTSSTWNIL